MVAGLVSYNWTLQLLNAVPPHHDSVPSLDFGDTVPSWLFCHLMDYSHDLLAFIAIVKHAFFAFLFRSFPGQSSRCHFFE